MKYYQEKYNDIIEELVNELKGLIEGKGVESEHMYGNCLQIDIDGDQHYSELVYCNDKLLLLNDDGYHYDFSQLGDGDEFFARVDSIVNQYC